MHKLHVLPDRLGLEFKTIQKMVHIYCRAFHQQKVKTTTCETCLEFIRYANEKLDRCPYGQDKPTCNKCPIHCYKQQPRQQAQNIMRYAGPRMLIKHPILAIKHLFAEKRPIPKKIADKASNRHVRQTKQ